MPGVTLVLIGLLLTGCAQPIAVKTQRLETTYCDPNERNDCWSLPQGVLRELVLESAENDKLKAGMAWCQRGSL